MKDLLINESDGQFTVDSREIAEMVDMKHFHLLEKIDFFIVVMRNSIESDFRLNEFFIEGSYQDPRGRQLRKFDCTRKGCDMVANKLTGEKGVLFTAAYVTKFEQMEAQSNPYNRLSKELRAIIVMDDKVQKVERRVEKLENTTTIDHRQQQLLKKAGNSVVIVAIGGKESAAYQNSSLRQKVYAALWNGFKDYFEVGSRNDTLRRDFDKALNYVKSWTMQGGLLREVENANRQMTL